MQITHQNITHQTTNYQNVHDTEEINVLKEMPKEELTLEQTIRILKDKLKNNPDINILNQIITWLDILRKNSVEVYKEELLNTVPNLLRVEMEEYYNKKIEKYEEENKKVDNI